MGFLKSTEGTGSDWTILSGQMIAPDLTRPNTTDLGPPNGGGLVREISEINQGNRSVGEILFHLARFCSPKRLLGSFDGSTPVLGKSWIH